MDMDWFYFSDFFFWLWNEIMDSMEWWWYRYIVIYYEMVGMAIRYIHMYYVLFSFIHAAGSQNQQVSISNNITYLSMILWRNLILIWVLCMQHWLCKKSNVKATFCLGIRKESNEGHAKRRICTRIVMVLWCTCRCIDIFFRETKRDVCQYLF